MNRDETKERPFFLFVGRLEKLKGIQDIIPLFKDYEQADLVIVGSGTYQKVLQSLANGNPRIKFLGNLPFNKLANLYSNAVALITPSLCYETFGQVIIEAFAMKTPVIAKDIGALSELVRDSGGGMLYRDTQEVSKIMDLLQTDPNLRNSLGLKGYHAYLEQWTEDRYLDRYLGLISETMSKKRSDLCSV